MHHIDTFTIRLIVTDDSVFSFPCSCCLYIFVASSMYQVDIKGQSVKCWAADILRASVIKEQMEHVSTLTVIVNETLADTIHC